MAVFVVAVALVPAGARAASVGLTIDGLGHLTAQLQVTIPNGSALREAMDGNFVPLIGLVTTNASQQASLLSQISAAEATPFVSAYFGNRDGTVSPSEVSLFETLLQQESQLLPSNPFTSTPALSLTLDGVAPASVGFSSISFGNAAGPADSVAAMLVTPSILFSFPYSGNSHVLLLSANVTSVGFTLVPIIGSVNLTLSLPAGQAVTGSSGFASSQVTNDPLGWGTSTFSGSYPPSTHSVLSISFGSAFPTGDVILGVLGIVAALGVALVLIRRRRRRAAPLPAEPTP